MRTLPTLGPGLSFSLLHGSHGKWRRLLHIYTCTCIHVCTFNNIHWGGGGGAAAVCWLILSLMGDATLSVASIAQFFLFPIFPSSSGRGTIVRLYAQGLFYYGAGRLCICFISKYHSCSRSRTSYVLWRLFCCCSSRRRLCQFIFMFFFQRSNADVLSPPFLSHCRGVGDSTR